MKYFFLSLLVVALLTVGVFGFRGTKFARSPIEIFPDMDRQDVVKSQTRSDFFHDGKGSRLPVAGTVPMSSDSGLFPLDFGEGRTGHYYTGAIDDYFATGLPVEELDLSASNMDVFLRRGEDRYAIFCAICHGETGDGQGVAAKYGVPNVANFHQPMFQPGTYPEGQIYHVIAQGKGNMGAYGSVIPVRDRWAIVAYVRALQASQAAGSAPAPAPEEATPAPEGAEEPAPATN